MRRLHVEDDGVRRRRSCGGPPVPRASRSRCRCRSSGSCSSKPERLQHRAADQHPRGVDRQHVAEPVVLALVVLAALQAGLAAAGAADRDADLEQPPQRRPLAELRAEDRADGVAVGRPRAAARARRGPGCCRRGAATPTRPAGGPGVRRSPARTAAARTTSAPAGAVARRRRRGVAVSRRPALVGAARVHGDDPVGRPGLVAQPAEDAGNQRAPVVADQQAAVHRSACVTARPP